MFRVVLNEPEIPDNTGNIGRLCVALGASLHITGQPGFRLDDRSVRRAGLDYWEHVELYRHVDLLAFEATQPVDRLFCFSAHADVRYTEARYQAGDALVFGSETRGLPPEVLARHARRVFAIPILTGKVRSLNLANAVAIVMYEALRQVQTSDGR